MKPSLETIRDYTTIGEYFAAKEIYENLNKIEKEPIFSIGAVYKAGIIKGKQMERARRKQVTT